MPRSTHAHRTKEGLPSSLDKVFPCLWGLEDYVHPRPGPAEPFHSAFLSGLRCCLASARVLGVSLPGDLPSSFLTGSLPALPLGSFPWFLYHRKPGPQGVTPPTSPSHFCSALPKPGEMIFLSPPRASPCSTSPAFTEEAAG